MRALEQETDWGEGAGWSATTRVARVVADQWAPGTARGLVRLWLGDHALADNAALALSEVVTNAVVHGGSSLPPLMVRFRQEDGGFRVEVEQATFRTIAPRGTIAPHAGSHRHDGGRSQGLTVVETLSERWGVNHARAPANGTTVWFEMDENDKVTRPGPVSG